MTGKFRPLLSLLLLVILAVYSTKATQADEPNSTSNSDKSHTTAAGAQASAAQKVEHEQRYEARDAYDASDLVDQALSSLRSFDHRSRLTAQRNSGIFGSILFYAKELLPRLYIAGPPGDAREKTQDGETKLKGAISESVDLLERAASRHNPDAIFLLAEMNFYGNFTHPKNYNEAFKRYTQLASLDGNSSAQHMIGFMYATGIGGAVKRDQAKALLYHTFAAQAGHTKSEMTVAFRHHSGISTTRNCDEAAYYYKKVADKAIKWYRSGPPGGMAWVPDSYRLADEEGGVYGEGASASSAGHNAPRGGPNSDANAALEDILEYLDLMSGKGDFKATFSLGRINYDGQKDLPRNLEAAKRYFQTVASQYWKRNGQTVDTTDKPGLDDIACKAAGYLGRMFLRGEGVKQDFSKAQKWFLRGLKNSDAGSQHGLGLMYLNGHGVPINNQKAFDYFKAAADQNYAPAQVQVGAMYLDQGSTSDIQMALRYFEFAARYGAIEAYYFLGELLDQGVGRERNCIHATAYYKSVAEKAEPLVSSFAEANEAFENTDLELALIDYMMAAEQGYEKAQANVAYLLDQEKSMLSLQWLWRFFTNDAKLLDAPRLTILRDSTLAIIYWTRSAKQSNIDSMVKMGDYYLNGIGTQKDMEKAAACYTAASEHQQSAQALYNLGWMHENGVGMTQDYHLAKRYYDHALETNLEAYLPVTLSLLKLRVKSAWNTITHGNINSIHDEPVVRKQWSLREWISNFLQDGQEYYDDYDEEDLLPHHDGMPGGDEDGLYDDLDDGLIETVVIMILAAALVWLIYYRQAVQMRHRQRAEALARQNGQQVPAPEQPENGLFPQPGDPEFPGWVAGGIGH